MIRPWKETIQLHKNQRIAQIILLPYIQLPNPVLRQTGGDKGFGSTEMIAWTQEITKQRPLKTVKMEGKNIQGLVDTGGMSSVFSDRPYRSTSRECSSNWREGRPAEGGVWTHRWLVLTCSLSQTCKDNLNTMFQKKRSSCLRTSEFSLHICIESNMRVVVPVLNPSTWDTVAVGSLSLRQTMNM